jgi:hypothetical protein
MYLPMPKTLTLLTNVFVLAFYCKTKRVNILVNFSYLHPFF